jgi:hypothetical protein
MAARTPGSSFLPALLLCIVLLLSGCADKNQAVSDTAKRPDLSSAGDSISGGTAPGADESDKAVKGDAGSKPETDPGAEPGGGKGEPPGNTGDRDVPDNSNNGAQQDGRNGQNNGNGGNGNDGTGAGAPKEGAAPGSGSSQPAVIKFSEMYAGGSSRGLQFSRKFAGLSGKKVQITGYMAPPLKPNFTFFVLTRQPMAICPFCSTDASWPEDIILIYLPEGESRTPTESVLRVTGTLELGSHTDPDTGFVSQARIYSDKIEVVK